MVGQDFEENGDDGDRAGGGQGQVEGVGVVVDDLADDGGVGRLSRFGTWSFVVVVPGWGFVDDRDRCGALEVVEAVWDFRAVRRGQLVWEWWGWRRPRLRSVGRWRRGMPLLAVPLEGFAGLRG